MCYSNNKYLPAVFCRTSAMQREQVPCKGAIQIWVKPMSMHVCYSNKQVIKCVFQGQGDMEKQRQMLKGFELKNVQCEHVLQLRIRASTVHLDTCMGLLYISLLHNISILLMQLL